jgi:hypothetical protein
MPQEIVEPRQRCVMQNYATRQATAVSGSCTGAMDGFARTPATERCADQATYHPEVMLVKRRLRKVELRVLGPRIVKGNGTSEAEPTQDPFNAGFRRHFLTVAHYPSEWIRNPTAFVGSKNVPRAQCEGRSFAGVQIPT